MTKPPPRFAILCSRATFSEDEIRTLERYGCRFEDLIAGRRPCRTPAQQRFVEVAKGQRDPETYYERLWRKYLVRLEREFQHRPRSTAAAQGAGRSAASRVPTGSSPASTESPRYRTVADPPPTIGPIHNVPNDRKDWKRMRGRQWGDAMRRARGDD